jgi:hypothetical protein
VRADDDVLVLPGYIIVADDDGAVVEPAQMAEALLANASTHHEWEESPASASAKAATCAATTRSRTRRGRIRGLGGGAESRSIGALGDGNESRRTPAHVRGVKLHDEEAVH